MACTTATWSPSSLQLRLALNCRGSSCNSPSVLVRSRFKKLNRPVHLRCFGPSAGRRRGCSLSIRSESNAESFSGWSESGNDGEQSIESQKKGGLGGVNFFVFFLFFFLTWLLKTLRKINIIF